jgi:hypothetical protein
MINNKYYKIFLFLIKYIVHQSYKNNMYNPNKLNLKLKNLFINLVIKKFKIKSKWHSIHRSAPINMTALKKLKKLLIKSIVSRKNYQHLKNIFINS